MSIEENKRQILKFETKHDLQFPSRYFDFFIGNQLWRYIRNREYWYMHVLLLRFGGKKSNIRNTRL